MKTGFIGGGNMSRAIIGGLISSGFARPDEITVSDIDQKILDGLERDFGVKTTRDNRTVALSEGIILLAVKPQFYPEVIAEVKSCAGDDKIFITIAPGWTIERLYTAFGCKLKIVRAMPNTPALVGEGMSAFCPGETLTPDETQLTEDFFGSFGRAVQLPERLMDSFVGLCGSSPAFVFVIIEAMADAAVREGFPRTMAYTLAAQAVLGSAKMVLESGQHPAELKDNVCSPAGTTIEGVAALEEKGVRHAIMTAVQRACAKSRDM